ncbi:hypothetical protein KX409_20670, partial [Escherichia coli]|uniref:hypothetical protein n=2 Tax=Escherichia coli TaxID=562 RepID=UPI001BDCC9EB
GDSGEEKQRGDQYPLNIAPRDCRKETKTVQYARVPLADGRREHLKAGKTKAPDKHSCLTRGLTFFLQQEEG